MVAEMIVSLWILTDFYICSSVCSEVFVKFPSDQAILKTNLTASRLCEISLHGVKRVSGTESTLMGVIFMILECVAVIRNL